jgi:hypothetical protein
MAYVNEKISKEDFEKYDLAAIEERLPYGSPNDHWAIDRERGMWFRLYRFFSDKENFGAETCTFWNFYWKESLILVETKTIKKIPPIESKVFYVMLKISRLEIPNNVLQHKAQILKDLKEAFEVSQMGLGIYIRDDDDTVCKVDFEYEGELI